MQEQFAVNIIKKGLFNKKHRLLLAYSGGIDSTCLAALLKDSGYSFDLAHCNFGLRGKESDGDEHFSKKMAARFGCEIYVQRFDTKTFAAKNKMGMQEAARHLRYAWFGELIKEKNYDYLLTAHHADDLAETMLLNLVRGTGIKGLSGIKEKNERTVRPLITFTRKQVEELVKQKRLTYRTDSSNSSNKYDRNFIRNKVMPLLRKINPSLTETFLNNASRFTQEADIVNTHLSNKSLGMISTENGTVKINKHTIASVPYAETLIHHLLGPYGFNASTQSDILRHLRTSGLPGKIFFSPSHRLTVTAGELNIEPATPPGKNEFVFQSMVELKRCKLLKINSLKGMKDKTNGELIISRSKLEFPLTLRAKKEGDRMKPLGMTGFKLLSDILKEKKRNRFERERSMVLVNGNGDLVWLAGLRSDERYKVKGTEDDLIKIAFVGSNK